MVKSVSAAWIWFLGLFIIILSALSTNLFFQARKNMIKQKQYIDSLYTYKKLYTELNNQYQLLSSKYNIALRSAIEGNASLAQQQQQLVRLQQVIHKRDSIIRSLKYRLKQVLIGYKSDELQVETKDGKIYITMRNKLLFPFGSAQVQPNGIKALGQLAKVLKENPDLEILIEGHTDYVPIRKNSKCWKDNWDLSAARAISVARILINKYGINPERIEIAGKAEYDPVASNLTEKGRALNRRIEVIVAPNLSELYKILEEK